MKHFHVVKTNLQLQKLKKLYIGNMQELEIDSVEMLKDLISNN